MLVADSIVHTSCESTGPPRTQNCKWADEATTFTLGGFVAYRDTDDSLWTYEAGVSHDINVDIATLTLAASAGLTETSSSTDSEYYEVSATFTRSVTENLDAVVLVAHNDAEDRDGNTFGALGFKVRF